MGIKKPSLGFTLPNNMVDFFLPLMFVDTLTEQYILGRTHACKLGLPDQQQNGTASLSTGKRQ